ALDPPMVGVLWHSAQLAPLNTGPRPEPMVSIVAKAARPASKRVRSAAVSPEDGAGTQTSGCFWSGFGKSLQLSQTSPTPSWSVSVWSLFAMPGQLSGGQTLAPADESPKPSPSRSVQGSQASPNPSPSLSRCSGSATPGQSSHASPTPSWSVSACAGSKTVGQSSGGQTTAPDAEPT